MQEDLEELIKLLSNIQDSNKLLQNKAFLKLVAIYARRPKEKKSKKEVSEAKTEKKEEQKFTKEDVEEIKKILGVK